MKKFFFLLFLIILTVNIFPQFGKNKIRNKDFKWKVYESQKFDIYYYDVKEEVIVKLKEIVRKSIIEYESRLNIQIKNEIPIILYLSRKDFQQTNIIDGFISDNIGGFVEMRKSRLVIPFNGDYYDFERVLKHEMIHIFQYNYMYPEGSFFEKMYKAFSRPPLWLMEGMAEYFSKDWQPIGRMMLRENILSSDIPSISLLNDSQFMYHGYYGYKLAQSYVEFLSKEYGEDKVVKYFKNLANNANSDYKKEFKKIFPRDIEIINQLWKEDLKKNYWGEVTYKKNPYRVYKVVDFENRKNVQLFMPKISPGGEVVALYANYKDETNILLVNLKNGKLIKNLTKNFSLNKYLSLKISPSSLIWSDDGNYIYYIAKKTTKDIIIRENIFTKNIKIFESNDIKTINGISISDKEKLIYLIGIDKSYTNIYRYDINKNKIFQLTDTIYYKKDLTKTNNIIYYIEKREYGDYLIEYSLKEGNENILYQTDTINSIHYNDNKIFFDRFFEDSVYICFYDLLNTQLYQIKESINSTLYPNISKNYIIFNIYRNNNYKLGILDNNKGNYIKMTDYSYPEKFKPLNIKREDIKNIKEKSEDYSIKLAPDYFTGMLEYNTGGYFRSYTTIMGMDMFGDYRYQLNLDITSVKEIDDIDFQFNFSYLKQRYSLGVSLYSWTDYFFNINNVLYDYTEKNYGGIASVSYPLSIKDRLEFYLNYNRKLVEWIYGEVEEYNEYSLYAAFVRDSSKWWGYYHPLSGYRVKISYQKNFELDKQSLNYGMLLSDIRYYLKLTRRASLAQRVVYGEYRGDDPQNFKIGGINTVRGYDYQSLLGNKILLYNAELRIPLIDLLLFPIKDFYVPYIRGVFFYDMAFIGDSNEEISILNNYENDNLKLDESIKASAGYGLRLYLNSFLNLKFDWAWRTDLEGLEDKSYFHFGIGSDF